MSKTKKEDNIPKGKALLQRDPKKINDYIQVQLNYKRFILCLNFIFFVYSSSKVSFADVLAEPEGLHSWLCAWKTSEGYNKIFQFSHTSHFPFLML